MDTTAAFSRGDTLNTVYAAFILQASKDVFAFDMGDDLFDTTQFGCLFFNDLDLPTIRFGVTLVHAQQIACEQCRLVTARTGSNFKHCRLCISGIFGQQGEL